LGKTVPFLLGYFFVCLFTQGAGRCPSAMISFFFYYLFTFLFCFFCHPPLFIFFYNLPFPHSPQRLVWGVDRSGFLSLWFSFGSHCAFFLSFPFFEGAEVFSPRRDCRASPPANFLNPNFSLASVSPPFCDCPILLPGRFATIGICSLADTRIVIAPIPLSPSPSAGGTSFFCNYCLWFLSSLPFGRVVRVPCHGRTFKVSLERFFPVFSPIFFSSFLCV